MKENEDAIIVRDSNMEMLRIFSMFLIVFYHLVCFFVINLRFGDNTWTAIQPCVHQGVILFVLISGFYGIRTKTKGVIHILLLCFLYYVPASLIFISFGYEDIFFGGGKSWINSILPISRGPYWFVRTYLYLYLLAPVINSFIQKSYRNLIYMFLVTGLISIYMSNFGIDPSLSEGKNIINFIFLYSIGRLLYVHKSIYLSIDKKIFAMVAIILNAVLFTILHEANSILIKDFIHKIFFPYYSLGLIVNSIVIFCLFAKFSFQSKTVNIIAGSMFSVYLIHHQPFLMQYVLKPMVEKVESLCGDDFSLLVVLIIITIVTMVSCTCVDIILKPLCAALEKFMLSKMSSLGCLAGKRNLFYK